jgi:molecular chaperone GrpE
MNKDEFEKEIPDTDEMPVTDENTDTDVEFEEVNEEGEVDARATIKKLREKVRKLESEKKEYVDLSQRLRADYLNLKKEIDHERVEGRKFASRRIIEEILPVLDAYDMAQGNREAWEAVDKNWRLGIEHIFSQLKQVLEREGVIQFASVGDAFDPNLHESMEHVPVEDETKDNTLVQVLQKGYRMKDMIIRPARVKTGEFKK